AGYSAAQVKRIRAEVSQAEAKQHGAIVEDALTEADALAAVGQDERQEERAFTSRTKTTSRFSSPRRLRPK
ncbi:hypothetical protein ACMUDO_19125, partial [Vibrio cholerae]